MNKDLDERLIPNGEYRDAQNIEIVTSEGSDIGSIQNSLGNTLINGKKLNVGTNTVSNWSSSFISNLTNAECIGHVVDNENNKIYWVIASDEASCIAEYDDVTKEVLPVLVDMGSILNFSKDYLVTGINVIEGLLAWTDNKTDPKKINIEKFKSGSVDFATTTKYNGTVMNATQRAASSNFKNENVTTIKLAPRNAPTLTLSSSKRSGVGTSASNNSVIVSYNFSSISIGEDFTIGFAPTPNFLKDDIITLTTTQDNSDKTTTTYNLTIKITELLNEANSVRASLLTKPNDIPDNALLFTCLLDEGKPLFEKKLVRFAYRWKYNDGEYSTFSPFSDVAFLPGTFEYKSDDGFNDGMLNTVKSIVISGFEKPIDVEKIEVLLKESNNNLIYVTHTITDTSTSYTVESETLGLVIPSNQLLRPWDNVPLKAKAQETIGNRLVYANYIQGYNIQDNNIPEISVTSKVKNRTSAIGVGEKSIKSERTYQIGVVYSDYFQRETPVFSSKKSSAIINKIQADSINSLSARIDSIPPDWATHYKYFVKETSNEYYNLALDRFYIAKDDSVWLSFPSSERNKIQEERYITLKKKHDSNNFVKEEAKYRILDIQNEAPRSLTVDINLKSSYRAYVLTDPINRPAVNSSYFKFRGPTDVENPEFARSFNSLGYVSITSYDSSGKEIGTTDKYKIESGGINGETNGSSNATIVYEVNLEDGFESKESSILSSTNLEANEYFKVNIYQETSSYKSEFSGRFFVKVNRDTILDENVIDAFSLNKVKYSVKEKQNISLDSTNDFTEDNGENSGISWKDSKAEHNEFLDLRILDNEHPALDNKTFSFVLSGVDTGKNTIEHHLENQLSDFLSKINTAGTLIQFSNSGGFTGGIYKITSCNVIASYRSDAKSSKKKLSGKRRRYNVQLESIKDGGGYFDNFLVSGSTSSNGIITEIAIVKREIDFENDNLTSNNPAIFETEPITSVDLDLFYEASNQLFILKPGMKIQNTEHLAKQVVTGINNSVDSNGDKTTSISWSGTINSTINTGYTYRVWSSDELYYKDIEVTGVNTTTSITLSQSNNVHGFSNGIDWFNCFSFGNGVESNRIQDDFNAIYIDKGPTVSSTIDTRYKEDHKKSGLIFSGIINSISGVNDLNQFIQAEAITKELNPEYGSIQRLVARDTDLVTFCEDKVVRILANKDALYNADGNPQLTASNNVLGQTIPYLGEYGCSKFPEAICSYGYRMYFLDRARSCVLRLSRDGITNISEKGMGDWFSDNIPLSNGFLGTFDENKKCYNLTLNNYTISFDERVDGWTSFRSFLPEFGTSLNGLYYTFNQGLLYSHNNAIRNNFYGSGYQSSVNVLMNEAPSSIKQFKTLNYEGSDSRKYTYSGSSQTLAKTGWYANSLKTEKQTGVVKEFVEKEGLWSNFISGDTTSIDNLDEKEFTVQGVGTYASIAGATARTQVTITKTLATVDGDLTGKITISDPVSFVQNINTSNASNTTSFTITPLTGYTLVHSNFSGSGCTFSQSGANVTCSLASTDTSVTSDISNTVNVSHSGALATTTYSVGLTHETFEENTSTLSRTSINTYTGGVVDVESTLFTIAFTSDSGFEFDEAPVATVVYSNGGGGDNMYRITNNWSASDKDAVVTFTVRYTFGSKNPIGDKITFVAKAIREIVAVPTSITGVNFSKRTILSSGETRGFKIFGTPGATFNITKRELEQTKTVDAASYTVITNYGTSTNSVGNNISFWHGTTYAWQDHPYVGQHYIPASGVYDFDEVIPALTNSNEKYIYYRIDPGINQYNDSANSGQVFNNQPLTIIKRTKFNANGTIAGNEFPGANIADHTSTKANFLPLSTQSATWASGFKLTFASAPPVVDAGDWSTDVTWDGMPGGRRFIVSTTGNSGTEINLKEQIFNINTGSSAGFNTYRFVIPGQTSDTQGTSITAPRVQPASISQIPSGTVITFSKVNANVFGDIVIKQMPDVKVKLKLKKSIPDQVYAFPGDSIATTSTRTGTATAKVNNAISNTTALVVDTNSGTIVVGDRVTGSGVDFNVTVASLTNQNNLVLSSAQSISNDVDLTFSAVTTSATYDIISSYSEHEPISGSSKYIANISKIMQAIDVSGQDAQSFILSELEEVGTDDFKYQKATLTYTGTASITTGTSLSFTAPATSTANVKGAISGVSTLVVDGEVGDIIIGDVISGTGISGTPTVTAVDLSETDETTLTLSENESLSNDTVLTFTRTITTTIPGAVYVGSSIDYNIHNSDGTIVSSHTNTVAGINTDRTVITLGTAITGSSTITTGTVFLFNKTTPENWDFNLKNTNGTITGTTRGNTYSITGDLEISKYGLADLTLELDLDKLLSHKRQGVATVFVPTGTTKKAIKTLVTGDVLEAALLSGHNRIEVDSGSSITYRGTGYIIAELDGNELKEGNNNTQGGQNQIVITATSSLIGSLNSPKITVLEIFGLKVTNPDYTSTWTSLSNGKYQGGPASKLGFTWAATIANGTSVSDPLNIQFGVTKSGASA